MTTSEAPIHENLREDFREPEFRRRARVLGPPERPAELLRKAGSAGRSPFSNPER
jgi:hypothetical protein